VNGVDIDNVLKKFKESQNFNLTDVGALLIAGPVGLAVTKGADFVSLATVNLDPSQQTHIQELLTQWEISNYQLRTRDVALRTSTNRIAFDGVIDLGRDSIPGLTIAVIDANGCSLMDQKLYGKTNALKTGKLNIAKTMLGPVVNFVNAVVGKDCVPVYEGKVHPPEPATRTKGAGSN
jgi:AsmA protein